MVSRSRTAEEVLEEVAGLALDMQATLWGAAKVLGRPAVAWGLAVGVDPAPDQELLVAVAAAAVAAATPEDYVFN